MSTEVDQRVVEMRFDNKQFESNVSTTISSLDKLKQRLNLTGATKGLEDVNSAAKKVDMTPLVDSVQTVGLKFNWLHTYADQTMRRITDSVNSAAKRIVSALTIDPVKMGFSEYETQINAVQTILANTESKGKTLEDVNSALDELNKYADKTIYNFTEMTRNIGTFTAAGVDLDTSVSAIKGIANLAAVSGSTSQQASTAMYQLSQAMASGTVKLMDWNSVVNAGMGGQVFQDALKETARVHGIAIDDIINKQGSFRESLSEGWLSTEILTETLSKFTGDLSEEQLKSMGYTEEQIKSIMKLGQTANDAATKVKTFSQLFDTLKEAAQSGWTQTWEIIVGDFEEAKAFLTEVSDTIGGMLNKSAEARNEMLENWKVLGGRTALIDSLRNVFEGLGSIITPIKEAFREIFPPMTAERLFELTEGLKNLTEKLKIGDDTADKIKRTFKGLFAVIDIAKQIFVEAFKGVMTLFGGIDKLGGGLLDATANIGDWLVKLNESVRSSEIFNKIFQGIAEVLGAVAKAGLGVLAFLKERFVAPGIEVIAELLSNLKDNMGRVGDAAGGMKDGIVAAFDEIGSFLANCSVFKLFDALWKAIKIIASGIGKAFSALTGGLVKMVGANDFSGILDFVNSVIAGGIGIGIIKFLKSLKQPLDGLGDMLDNVTGILDGVRGCFEAYQSQLKAGALMKIAGAIALLTAALVVLSLIEGDRLSVAIGAITTLFVELMTAMSFIGKIDKTGLIKTSVGILVISEALLILALAMKLLSTMSWSDLGVALAGLTGGLGALIIAVNLLPDRKVNKAAKAMRQMSTALLILSLALKIMGSMSWSEMAVGLVTMAASLGILVAALHLLPKDVGLKVIGMVSLATALVILAAALKIMSTMSWGEMAVGLAALAGSMLILVVALNSMKMALPGALAMLIVAPALILLASALKIMATMSWEELGIGLVALAGSLTVLAIALNAMLTALPGAAALLVATAALAVLAPVLVLLGSMSWESIAKGLITIAGAFAIIGVAALVLSPLIPAILALAGAIALIGVGTLAAGIGLMAFGAGLSALAIGFTAIVASLGAIVTGIIALVSAVVTGIIKGIGDGIIAFCNVIIEGAPAICEALTVLIVSLCDAIIESVPAIIECIDRLLTSLLDFIVDFTPKLIDAGVNIIVALIDGITRNIGKIANSAVRCITAFLEAVGSMIPAIVMAAVKMMVNFINGLADGIRENTPKVIDAVNNLMSAVAEAIGAAIGNVPVMGKQIVQGLIKGIKGSAGELFNSMVSVVKNAWNGVLDFLGINSPSRLAAEAGMGIDEGLVVGLKKYTGIVDKAATNVGKSAMTSLSDAVAKASDIVSSDIDHQPTIRPVLDLSDVESGAGTIGGLLGGSSVGVTANVGAISSMMSRHGQNGGESEVVSEIKKLRKDMSNMKTESVNINGVTYDDGSNITEAVRSIVRAAKVERRL